MEYVYTIGTIALTLIYYGFGTINDSLTFSQRTYMVISTYLFMILFGWVREKVLKRSNDISVGLLGFMYVNWYYWSTLFSNLITVDKGEILYVPL